MRSLKVAMSYHLVARAFSCKGDFRTALLHEKDAYAIYKGMVSCTPKGIPNYVTTLKFYWILGELMFFTTKDLIHVKFLCLIILYILKTLRARVERQRMSGLNPGKKNAYHTNNRL